MAKSREMREMVKIIDNSIPREVYEKNKAEHKDYLVCLKAKEGSGEWDIWDIIHGRLATYEFIKENIDMIDFESSFVLVDTLTLKDRKSIYAFMQYAREIFGDSFDLESYIRGDWDENDYRDHNDISRQVLVDNEDRVDMESLMGGNVDMASLE